MNREIDWDVWLNRLIFCHGCGRFGMPKERKPPTGWKLIYQPHPDGRSGLYACSSSCEGKLKDAMKEGPIVDPLEMRPPPMPHELQEQVTQLVRGAVNEERAREQERALAVIQETVEGALRAALEANEGKPLAKQEAVDVVTNAVMDAHCNMGMTVTANVEIDDQGVATAEVAIASKLKESMKKGRLWQRLRWLLPTSDHRRLEGEVDGRAKDAESTENTNRGNPTPEYSASYEIRNIGSAGENPSKKKPERDG